MSVSALVMVMHEEHNIRSCLESIKDVVDEIVVVHDGPCHDKTLDIAKMYTNNIHVVQKSGGSSEFNRGLGITFTTGEWVFMIDADERFSDELKKALPLLVHQQDIDAFSVRWPFFENGKQVEHEGMKKYRKSLFRKSKTFHLGVPHEGSQTTGVHKKVNLVLEHHFAGHTKGFGLLFSNLRKNWKRGKRCAEVMHIEKAQLRSFQCSLQDTHLKGIRKYRIMKQFPLFSLLILPIPSFCYRYFAKEYMRYGMIGFATAINVPSYYAFMCMWSVWLRTKNLFSADV